MSKIHEFTIYAAPRTKKNHSRVIYKGTGNKKYPIVLPSKQYIEFEKQAEQYCPKLMIDYPVNVQIVAYVERRNKVDLANMLNAIDDILVKYGTVTDDNRNIIYMHDGSKILYDKDHPRVEVTITKIPQSKFEEWKVK